MVLKFKKLLPRWMINYFYHLPKAILANIYYGFPTRGIKVIGVTGTDGKTTTVNMIYQILKASGKKVSMVSTINAVIAGFSYDTGFHVTSPEPTDVQKFARLAKDHGDDYLVLEVTSHALDQFRFWGIKFNIGVITNITHDHLDYHKTFENYFQTKVKLLRNVTFAIVNENIRPKLSWEIRKQVLTFGLRVGHFNQKDADLRLKIPGNYNIENALAALAVATVLKVDQGVAKKALAQFTNLSGRMEEVKNSKGIRVVVDFAHTPNALEQALKTLKKETLGKLISVFGCAGLRDVKKRAIMGKISTTLADTTVITAEDPRGQLENINRQILSGIDKKFKANKDYFVVADREKAIEFAIKKLAKRGDTVGIFGKGHETSMNYDGKKEISWSDSKTAKKYLNG